MSKEIEKLIEQIILAIQKITHIDVTEEIVENIRQKCSILSKTPEIRITSNPKEFDSNAINTKNFYEGTIGKSHRDQTYTDVLYGDYQPGLSRTKDYNNNSNISIDMCELSDFSMNKLQIALSSDLYDENSNVLVIYVPEAREYDVISYKEHTVNEQKQTLYNALYEKINQKVPEDQLHKLVDNFDFSNGIPEVKVISDPQKFDEAAKQSFDIYSDEFENESNLCVYTSTLYGNYQSGTDVIYEHRGHRETVLETDSPSDFDLNGVQIVFATNVQNQRFYNSKHDKESSSIIIYLPEKEYEEKSYKDYIEKTKLIPHDVQEVKNTIFSRSVSGIEDILTLLNQKRAMGTDYDKSNTKEEEEK